MEFTRKPIFVRKMPKSAAPGHRTAPSSHCVPLKLSKGLSMTPTRKNHLLLRILAVIGRYRPHLMIVMIFVTKITFKMLQEFPTISLELD